MAWTFRIDGYDDAEYVARNRYVEPIHAVWKRIDSHNESRGRRRAVRLSARPRCAAGAGRAAPDHAWSLRHCP